MGNETKWIVFIVDYLTRSREGGPKSLQFLEGGDLIFLQGGADGALSFQIRELQRAEILFVLFHAAKQNRSLWMVQKVKNKKNKIKLSRMTCWMDCGAKGFVLWFVLLFERGWERGRAKSKALRPKEEALWLDWADQRSPPSPTPPPLVTPPTIPTVLHPSPLILSPFPTPTLLLADLTADVKRPKSRWTFQQLPAICSASQV